MRANLKKRKSDNKYFTDEELKCHCGCGEALMDAEFMGNLIQLREHCAFPFPVTSAYRCEKHNKAVGGYPKSRHPQGKAVDILCYGDHVHKILALARRYNMKGIGVSQKGDFKDRFIHLDYRDNYAVWSY